MLKRHDGRSLWTLQFSFFLLLFCYPSWVYRVKSRYIRVLAFTMRQLWMLPARRLPIELQAIVSCFKVVQAWPDLCRSALQSILVDLTVHMDIEINPGPNFSAERFAKCSPSINTTSRVADSAVQHMYSKHQLLGLRCKYYISDSLFYLSKRSPNSQHSWFKCWC